MENLQHFIDYILHIDVYLLSFTNNYGIWAYALLFVIIFCETGLVVTPFLPGDSLLFAAGAITANAEEINIHSLFLLLLTASILGNALNYMIGRIIGPKIFYSPKSWFFNKKYLEQTQKFYLSHGGKTIIIARFIPIIRTFGPFVAGIARMPYPKFFFYNCLGGLLWVGGLLYVSYFFGNLPFVKENFSTIVLAIIGISLLPPILAFLYKKLFPAMT